MSNTLLPRRYAGRGGNGQIRLRRRLNFLGVCGLRDLIVGPKTINGFTPRKAEFLASVVDLLLKKKLLAGFRGSFVVASTI